MEAPAGTLIVYATAPGSVADDGDGRNGVFTGHLLKQMRQPGLEVDRMLRLTRKDVMTETGRKQVPWSSSSLTGVFYFKEGTVQKQSPAIKKAPLTSPPSPKGRRSISTEDIAEPPR